MTGMGNAPSRSQRDKTLEAPPAAGQVRRNTMSCITAT